MERKLFVFITPNRSPARDLDPVPDVVGTAIIGIGANVFDNSRPFFRCARSGVISFPSAVSATIPLVASITLPPPRATATSTLGMPEENFSIWEMRGLAGTESIIATGSPAASVKTSIAPRFDQPALVINSHLRSAIRLATADPKEEPE